MGNEKAKTDQAKIDQLRKEYEEQVGKILIGYLSPSEAAKRLNIQKKAIRTYILKGRLEGVKFDGVWHPSIESVEVYDENRKPQYRKEKLDE